jgi:hypothetical protein
LSKPHTNLEYQKPKNKSFFSVGKWVKQTSDKPAAQSDSRFKGVRKRKWGKYVSEIRLPNSRERIWLGSYDSAEKAARAFDAAQFCLRGRSARFNFPDNPPDIAGGRSLTPPEIQAAAARFANSGEPPKSSHSDRSATETLPMEVNVTTQNAGIQPCFAGIRPSFAGITIEGILEKKNQKWSRTFPSVIAALTNEVLELKIFETLEGVN